MAMVTLTSNYNTNLSQTLPFKKTNTNLRDVSFSTFLDGAEENYVRKLSASSRDLSPNITNTSTSTSTNQDEHHYTGLKKEEDGEIGVFGAEKYFNGGIHVESPRVTKTDIAKTLQCVKDDGVNIEPIKPVKLHQGTPSVRSESSSNSQVALLQGKKVPSKVNGKSFLSGLAGCKCYCSGRKSVDTEQVQVGEISFKRPSANGDVSRGKQNKTAGTKANLEVNKPVAEPWMKEDIFTFPAMNSATGIRPVKVALQGDEIGRKSLEVFGSPVPGKRNKSLNIERRLKMLSWDYSTKVEENYENPKGNHNDDAESDASSDLFEIESLTGKAKQYLVKQASDHVASGCVTPTTCYAPSEVSIDWSVVTASAVDFSAMSDYEELRPSITLPSPRKLFTTTTNANNKEYRKRRSSGLWGCNSQKAVEVAGDHTHKPNEKAGSEPRMRIVSDSYMPSSRFRAGTKLATAFQPSQTPRASHLLYIQ